MRVLGLDYGEKRIGVAISDPLGLTAQPVKVIEKGASFNQDLEQLEAIIEQYDGIEEILVGLPKTMSGEIGMQAEKIMKFVDFLKDNLKIKVSTWDERLTTAAAEKMLIAAGVSRQKRRQVIDKSAASYILQSYLDSKKK